MADPAADVFGAERPAAEVCDEAGLGPEDLGLDPVFEIGTDLCNYATVAQTTLVGLEPGDLVRLRLLHSDLEAADAAAAHLALALDGEAIWETTVPIPSTEAMIDESIAVERTYAEGVEIQFHVHNHGLNTYRLFDVEAELRSSSEP